PIRSHSPPLAPALLLTPSFSTTPPPPTSTLFPYTTLFRSTANDPDIDAVWFARGGYGACRIAEAVIPELTAHAWAKRYLGYSDADRKSTRLNSSHVKISYAVFCLKKKTSNRTPSPHTPPAP